jgi:hypothetical protein
VNAACEALKAAGGQKRAIDAPGGRRLSTAR